MQEEYTAPLADAMSTAAARMRLIEQYGNVCLRCGLQPADDDKPLAVDHIIPVARGGRNKYGNYQLLCGPCNSWKGTRIIDFRPGEHAEIDAGLPIIPIEERVRKTKAPVVQIVLLRTLPFVEQPTPFGNLRDRIGSIPLAIREPLREPSWYEDHLKRELEHERGMRAWAEKHAEQLSGYWAEQRQYTERAYQNGRTGDRLGCLFFILFWVAVAVAIYWYIY